MGGASSSNGSGILKSKFYSAKLVRSLGVLVLASLVFELEMCPHLHFLPELEMCPHLYFLFGMEMCPHLFLLSELEMCPHLHFLPELEMCPHLCFSSSSGHV